VAATLTFLPLLVSPCISAEKPGEEKKEVSAETKAQLLQDLDRQMEQRRSEIAREEEKLSAAKNALEAAKRELRQELDKLEALKKEIEGQIARREKVVSERMDTIAKVYKAMKPKEASAALQDMDNDMAVSILDRLPGNTVAKIFDTMPKERVRELTRRLEEGRSK
jgi:flagellar motility protein MotE (MotC chaperone)